MNDATFNSSLFNDPLFNDPEAEGAIVISPGRVALSDAAVTSTVMSDSAVAQTVMSDELAL